MSLEAAAESFMACLPELHRLFPQHYDKLALDRDFVALEPDYETYAAMETAGSLVLVTLRDAGRLVGYWVAIISPGLHYRTCLTAQLDMWNVLPGYETGVAAMILMRAVEREYTRRGVRRAFAGEKLHRPCGRLYKAFGYRPVEMQYSKMIGV